MDSIFKFVYEKGYYGCRYSIIQFRQAPQIEFIEIVRPKENRKNWNSAVRLKDRLVLDFNFGDSSILLYSIMIVDIQIAHSVYKAVKSVVAFANYRILCYKKNAQNLNHLDKLIPTKEQC